MFLCVLKTLISFWSNTKEATDMIKNFWRFEWVNENVLQVFGLKKVNVVTGECSYAKYMMAKESVEMTKYYSHQKYNSWNQFTL